MEVIQLDQSRRRRALAPKEGTGLAEVLPMARLSDGVCLRVMRRQARREMAQLQYLIKVTGGDPDMLPTLDQMGEIIDGTIEF